MSVTVVGSWLKLANLLLLELWYVLPWDPC